MTRNLTGGKNHKKAKQGSENPTFTEKKDDQIYARVIQILGNRNVLTFCNDNIVRLCHIRGSIRKDMWISVGDIVIISIRDFITEKDSKYEKGDILHKYDRDHHSKLKKYNTINNKLFLTLETMGVDNLKTLAGKKVEIDDVNEDLFEDGKNQDSDESIDVDDI
jgi:translation initiation factor 1A